MTSNEGRDSGGSDDAVGRGEPGGPADAEGLRRHARRLTARHRPGCWLAAVFRVFPLSGTAQAADNPPPHWLAAAWSPDPRQPALYPRLPEIAAIGSPDALRAIDELFVHLPADVQVLMVGSEHVDFALAAEMVVCVDRNLEAWQREALEAFVDQQREQARAAIASTCTDRDPGFERFRSKTLGED